MIPFPTIWWLFPAAALAYFLLSVFLARSGRLSSEAVRKSLVVAGAVVGLVAFALPFFAQPTFHNPLVQYGLGAPLFILGLVGRVYPMLYLRRQGTTTTLGDVGKLVDNGPYAWVRHPQYTAGLVMLLGWFLAWGAWYALCLLPLIAGIVYVQARIEETYILERTFGAAYAAYRQQVGMLAPRLAKDRSLRITVAFLGVYAGLLAVQHGIFALLQGSRAPDGLLINAIGPPCQPEAVWHACYPALTLIPNLFVSGVAAVLVGLGMAIWAVFFVERRRGGLVLAALSLVALLVGGGFVPVFIGLVAAAVSRGLHRPALRPRFAVLAKVWPWPLVVMAAWLPANWLLGSLVPEAMLAASGVLFVAFDVGLPVLAELSGVAANTG
jgi:protein-S-isoprenylcysteine O-methyltransferase Ste14